MDDDKRGINEPDLVRDKGRGINDPDLQRALERIRRCPHCKQELEGSGDVCPFCRKYLGEGSVEYQPLAKKTVQTVRWVLGLILLAVFIILVATGVFKIDACESEQEESLVRSETLWQGGNAVTLSEIKMTGLKV